MTHIPTASQTIGPFFNFGLTADPNLGVLARGGAQGDRIRLSLGVLDGDGVPAPGDAMIEIWQADAQARHCHPADPQCAHADPNCRGFGRLETSAEGMCVFETVKPGRVEGQAPHINVVLFARGLLHHLYTRVYFEGDPANDGDPVLALVPADRRATLMARPADGDAGTWHMDIRLQGEGETVFFDI